MAENEKTASQEPLYNIGVVTRATGVPITTLHAWERRYGFPRSSRTIGGHRLYTDRDISLLRWVKAQVDAGLATHRAILAAQRLDDEGKAPPLEASLPVRTAATLVPIPELRQQLRSVLFQNELGQADQILGDMLAFYSPEELALNVIGPILYEIGESWEAGEISVATEHLASNYLRQRLLIWMVSAPRSKAGNPIVLACAPGEWHDGSLLMMGVLLRRQGLPVAYLGQNVPFADLADFTAQIHPSAIVMVAMRSEPAAAMAEWPNWIKIENGRPLFAYGGRAFVVHPDLKNLLPGIYLGDTINGGVEKLIDQLEKQMQK